MSILEKCTQTSHKLFWPTRVNIIHSSGSRNFQEKRKHSLCKCVFLTHMKREQILQMKCQWALVGLGRWWITLGHPFVSPCCPVSAPCWGLPAMALPILVSSAACWVTSCAAALTRWHNFISAWHNRTGLGDSFIMPQIDINRCSKQM